MNTFLQFVASAVVVRVAYAQWSNTTSYSTSHTLNTSNQPSPVQIQPGIPNQPSSDNIILHTPSSLDQANISIVNIPGTSLTTTNATLTISVSRASYPWLPSDVPVQSFLSLKSCDKVWVDYSSAHRETYFITTTYPVSSHITEVTHTNNDIPVITLCDGIPRAGIITESSITRYLVTSEITTWSYVTNGTDQPSCSWNLQSCSTLWSLWDRQSTSWWQTATSLEPFSDAPDYWIPECHIPDTCEKSCFLFGTEEVDLYYFPEPWSTDIICGPNATRTSPWDFTEQKRAPSTIAIGNMTFTSPSAYLYFSTMYARAGYPTIGASKCGYDMSSVWVPVDPGELSTIPRRSKPQLAKPMTFANLAMTTVNGYEIPLVPSSAYWWPNSCHDNPYLLRNKCPPSTIHNDYRPDILYRTELQEMQPHWKNCKPLSQVAAMIYAMRDPPIPLTTAGNLVGDPGTTTSVHEPLTTATTAAEPSQTATGLLPTNTSPRPSQTTDKQSDPTQTLDAVNPGSEGHNGSPADPTVGSGDPEDAAPDGSDPRSSDPNNSDPGKPDSSQKSDFEGGFGSDEDDSGPGAFDPGKASDPENTSAELESSSDSGVNAGSDNVGGESSPAASSSGSSKGGSDSNSDPLTAVTIIVQPTTNSLAEPAGSAAVLTLGGFKYTALPGQDLALGTTTISAVKAAALLGNGQVVRVGSDGVVIDGSTVLFSSVDGGNAGGVAAAPTTGSNVVLSVGGSVTEIDGHTVSLAPSGILVVDDTSHALQSGGMGGTLITAGGQTFSIAGGADSAAVGGATRAATEAVLNIGSETLTAIRPWGSTGVVVIGDQTLSVAGLPVTTSGVVLSAGIDGVVINRTTTESFSERTRTGSDASSTSVQTGSHTASGGGGAAGAATSNGNQTSSASALDMRRLFILITTIIGLLIL